MNQLCVQSHTNLPVSREIIFCIFLTMPSLLVMLQVQCVCWNMTDAFPRNNEQMPISELLAYRDLVSKCNNTLQSQRTAHLQSEMIKLSYTFCTQYNA